MTHPSPEFLDLQAALAGEYSIQRELGRGGMGVVYLARDVQLDRDVAIKVLPAHLARTASARERFVREAARRPASRTRTSSRSTGRALVTDFGIAYGGRDPGSVTDPGKILGTRHFMSPEQAAGEAVNGRSDIYALGVVGYLAVSGRLPFEAANLPALLLHQATEEPPSVMRAAPGLLPALRTGAELPSNRDSSERTVLVPFMSRF